MRRSACLLTLALAGSFHCDLETAKVAPPAKPATAEEPKETEAQLLAAMRLEERDFPLLVWSAYRVSLDYFDPGRFAPKAQIESALEFLGMHSPEFFGQMDGDRIKVTIGGESRSFDAAPATSIRAAVEVLEPILVFARDTLALEGEPVHELEYAAINGFVAPLDSHTILLTPEQHADLGVKTRGRFGGIGAQIGVKDRRISVSTVLPGSPAERAGLLGGDLMLKIAGQSTVNMTPIEAQALLRGPIDTEVVVEIRREGNKLNITIVRGMIKIDSVQASRLGGDIGYVRVQQFQEDTAARFEAELKSFMKDNPIRGLVIDLRGNVGGLLTQATRMLDLLVDGGELVIVRSASGREAEEATPERVLGDSVPVVVLIDEGSASASEIVSGGIKHLGRGVVVGRGSFGKGSVQMLKPWAPYGRELAMKITVAEYRVAGERRIQTSGVQPDVRLHPVRLAEVQGVGQLFDFERFERERERSIVAGLPSARHEAGEGFAPPSKLLVRYLDGVRPAGSPPEADPEIRLARDFAQSLRDVVGRNNALQRIEGVAGGVRDREDAAIAAGVDKSWNGALANAWGTVPKASDQRLDLKAELSAPGPIAAGAPFTVKLSVTNPGSAPVDRVHVITDCAHDEIDGIEILLGRIAPGETIQQEMQMAVMQWRPDLHTDLSIAAHVGEPDAKADGHASVGLDITGAKRPAYAMDWWIVDDPNLAAAGPQRPPADAADAMPGDKPFVVRGNGDGVLHPGEQVHIAFRVTNVGAGPSPRASVVLRNLSGRQGLLEEGQVPIGALAAGADFSGAFGLSVSPTPLPLLPLELQITAGDSQMREKVGHKIRLAIADAVDNAPTVTNNSGTRRVVAKAVVRNAARADAPIVAELDAATKVPVVGSVPGFVAVNAGAGRRVWIADTALEETNGSARPLEIGASINPPAIEVQPASARTRTSDATFSVRGTAVHSDRVRDVVIWVRGSGPAAHDHKVWYGANPGEATRWEFAGDIPLAPGGNRIRIIARDADRIERWRDLWVHRDG